MTATFIVMGLSALAHGGKWDASESDVRVTKLIDASPEAIHAELDDLSEWAGRWPEDCATQYEPGPSTAGDDASARLRYTFGPMRRRLQQRIVRDDAGHVFEIEHAGKRGWYNQITYRQVDGGTEVVMLTPLTPPPWPFKPVFFNKIRPAMVDCYDRWLEALADQVVGG